MAVSLLVLIFNPAVNQSEPISTEAVSEDKGAKRAVGVQHNS